MSYSSLEFSQSFKKGANSNPTQTVTQHRKRRNTAKHILQSQHYHVTNMTGKENDRATSKTNTDAKILNETLAKQIKEHIK